MQILSFLIGLAILVTVTLDFIFTTIGAQERTILSFRVTRLFFRMVRRFTASPDLRWPHWVSGPLIMSALAMFWILGVSLAWTMVFHAWPDSIEAGPGRPPPEWWDTFAHIGHLLSTLGAGTTEAGDTIWYVISVFVAVNGMVILTLAVSFTLSTTQTVSRGRAFAALSELMDPADPGHFVTLAPWLAELCSSLKSAPFALFYSSHDPRLRLPGALVRVAENAAKGPRFEDFARIFRMLPAFNPEPGVGREAFLQEMRRWADDFSLSTPPGERARARQAAE